MTMNDQQRAYQEQAAAQLHEWAAKIQLLKAKAETVEAEAKARYQQQLQELQAKEQTARRKLAELAQAGADAWGSLKAGVESALSDLRDGLGKP